MHDFIESDKRMIDGATFVDVVSSISVNGEDCVEHIVDGEQPVFRMMLTVDKELLDKVLMRGD